MAARPCSSAPATTSMFVAPLMICFIAVFVLPFLIARLRGWGDEEKPEDEEAS